MRCATTLRSCAGILPLRPPFAQATSPNSAGGSADVMSSLALPLPLRPAACTLQPFPMPVLLLQRSMIPLHPTHITRPIRLLFLPPTTCAPCQRRLHQLNGQNRRLQRPVNSQNTETTTILFQGGGVAVRLIPAAVLRSQPVGVWCWLVLNRHEVRTQPSDPGLTDPVLCSLIDNKNTVTLQCSSDEILCQ